MHEGIKRIPNALTVMRILIVPILIAGSFLESQLYHYVAAGLFLLASVTDFFDGYLARRLKAQSRFGTLLDPIADKLLVASALLILVASDDIAGIHIIPAAAILCREILVSGLREFLAGDNIDLPVSNIGKCKTAVQMTAIFLLLLGVEGPQIDVITNEEALNQVLGRILLWIAGVMTVFSGYVYLRAGLKHL